MLHNEPIEKNLWDITKVDLNIIKQSDLVIYSPPCQSWSVAGKKKGINDIRGTLFWNALDIIKKSNPKYAIMENVNNLPERFTSDFEEMLKCLDDAGYKRKNIMVTSYSRGHEIYYNTKDNQWHYTDNNEITSIERPCKRCGCSPTQEGYDACLGHIDGVISACCGHGVEKGYIMYPDKTIEIEDKT